MRVVSQWIRIGICTWDCCIPRKHIRCKRRPFRKVVQSLNPLLPCRYGYVTNTKIKFVIVVDSANTALRENDVRGVGSWIRWY